MTQLGETKKKKEKRPEDIAIGKRIKQARENAGMSQRVLHENTQISITQISAYETGDRTIGLSNLALIAKETNTAIDELYFGPESELPISQSKDTGELIVNCINALFECGVIIKKTVTKNTFDEVEQVSFVKYNDIVMELVDQLRTIERSKNDFPDPESVKKQTLQAYANKINNRLEKNKQ